MLRQQDDLASQHHTWGIDMRSSVYLAVTAIVAAVALTGCTNHANQSTAPQGTNASNLNQPSSGSTAAPMVQLAWSHVGTFFDEPQVWYVARVKNPGKSVASVALNARALDKTGTIIGSSQDDLPNIPGGATFDYFGYLGGGGAFDTDLTGTPAKIQVSQTKNAFGQAGAIELPMLKTSELKFAEGTEDTNTNAPLSYNLTVKVTNSTRDELTGGVTQQVVLYDAAGHVVGGDTGASDNVPDSFPAGMSYREKWTGIPALSKVTRAVYTVWAG
ncbi:hypothetical protein ACFUEN_16010 [Streptomyces griseorubiginosus]|uniref:hypothetical protein n=1 Tax=Streptomyces griseorubiginosus TaxID=67304 RepID=UPI00363B679D